MGVEPQIGDISLSVQSKLLRVLQEREIIRVGGARTILVDVRVIAATNQDLEQKVTRKAFREDLYYRLDVVPIYIPPLRERKEDIPLIARHLAFKLNKELRRQVQEISEVADKSLMGYNWPGNVRELENILRRAMIYMRPQDTIMDIEHLPLFPCEKISILPSLSGPIEPLDKILKEVERSVIERAIKEKKGNFSEAAKLLNMTARNLYYKMKKYKLKEDID